MTAPSRPGLQGFRMPAEWEPHEATWLAWPHEVSDWPGNSFPSRGCMAKSCAIFRASKQFAF